MPEAVTREESVAAMKEIERRARMGFPGSKQVYGALIQAAFGNSEAVDSLDIEALEREDEEWQRRYDHRD